VAEGYPRPVGRRFELVVLALLGASLIAIGTLALRIDKTHDPRYIFLVWNLFLAWVPLIAASYASALARRGVGATVGVLIVVWLLFFPNAPYMLTDFVHLSENANAASPLWYDGLMLSSFAWTALMVGFVSLYLIHSIVARRSGVAVGWVVVVCVLGLTSIGVYLGRFAHFNSWDAVTRPRLVLSVIRRETDSPLHDPKMLAALLALTVALFVGYLMVYAFSALRPDFAEPA
jgi:uncharacterized membrane protein